MLVSLLRFALGRAHRLPKVISAASRSSRPVFAARMSHTLDRSCRARVPGGSVLRASSAAHAMLRHIYPRGAGRGPGSIRVRRELVGDRPTWPRRCCRSLRGRSVLIIHSLGIVALSSGGSVPWNETEMSRTISSGYVDADVRAHRAGSTASADRRSMDRWAMLMTRL